MSSGGAEPHLKIHAGVPQEEQAAGFSMEGFRKAERTKKEAWLL